MFLILRCRRSISILSFIAFLLPQTAAFADKLGIGESSQRDSAATVSLVEMNPADLLRGRYRLAFENLVFEGVSFSWTAEVQENARQGRFEERSLASGLSLQYYPQSSSLNGLFIRGESDLALVDIKEQPTARQPGESGSSAHVRLSGDVGWRVRLSERLTGSAAYGLRKTLDQPLWSQSMPLSERWSTEKSTSPDVRVQINLGVVL